MRPLGIMHTKRVCRRCGGDINGSGSLCGSCEREIYDDLAGDER